MRAEKVIRSLLMAASGVTALVSTRCRPPPLAQGTALPALTVEHISTVMLPTMRASSPYGLARSRIEVNVLAATYESQKAVMDAVCLACNYQRGVIGGVTVVQVLRDLVGPDLWDSDVQIYRQSVDFLVEYCEP